MKICTTARWLFQWPPIMRSPWIPIPCASREPRAASHARTICGSTCRQILVVSEPWKSTAPWTVRISDFFSMTWDMGGWNQQHQPKSAIEKSLSFFCSEYVYIYNEFSFCMFHIECVTCIVQLFFCNRMILKSHEPPGFLCPFYGAMVQEETRVVEGSQGSWQSFFMARWSTVKHHGIGLLGKILTGNITGNNGVYH
jgi:hypothetical protein